MIGLMSYPNFQSIMLENISTYSRKFVGEISELLLDGTEIAGVEDLLPLLAIACPPIVHTAKTGIRAGGFHAGLVGTRLASIRQRIIKATMDPLLVQQAYWNVFSSKVGEYVNQFSSRPSKAQEYVVFVSKRKSRTLPNLPFDYPLSIENAPKLKGDEAIQFLQNPDILNYLTFQRFNHPIVSTEGKQLVLSLSDELIEHALQREFPAHLIGADKFFDPNFFGKPETILRLALANARIADRKVVGGDIKLAKSMLLNALDLTIDMIKKDPRDAGISRETISLNLYKTIVELLQSYPDGVTEEQIIQHSEIKNPRLVRSWIDMLMREGKIFESPPGFYKTIEFD